MTITELKEKIEAFETALEVNARTGDNKIFADVAQTSLIKLQTELIQGLEARVQIAKRDTETFREAFEEVGHGTCDACDGPMFAEESHATFGGEQEICDGCYESALGGL